MTVVKAKRLGWDEKLTPAQLLDMDPYAYSDDTITGELEQWDVPATGEHPAIHVCLVGGQEADPETITSDFAWDESKHPRHGAGTEDGGRFAPAATPSATGEAAARKSKKVPEKYKSLVNGLHRRFFDALGDAGNGGGHEKFANILEEIEGLDEKAYLAVDAYFKGIYPEGFSGPGPLVPNLRHWMQSRGMDLSKLPGGNPESEKPAVNPEIKAKAQEWAEKIANAVKTGNSPLDFLSEYWDLRGKGDWLAAYREAIEKVVPAEFWKGLEKPYSGYAIEKAVTDWRDSVNKKEGDGIKAAKVKLFESRMAAYARGDDSLRKAQALYDRVNAHHEAYIAADKEALDWGQKVQDEADRTGVAAEKSPAVKKWKKAIEKRDQAYRAWESDRNNARQEIFDHLSSKVPANHRAYFSRKDYIDSEIKDNFRVNSTVMFGAQWLENVTMHPGDSRPLKFHLIPADAEQRAYHRGDEKGGDIYLSPNNSSDVVIHEIGHSIEHFPGVQEVVRGFMARRGLLDSPGKPLAEEFPDHGYDAWERGNPDDFEKLYPKHLRSRAWYTGKYYGDRSSEIVSMGVELLYTAPGHFAKHDPEYFKLICGILDGGLRQ